ncbi:MAG: hypothetical protein WD294_01635 [Phycisphaeraceae bacterium]
MNNTTFLADHGFVGDPFESTNAETEDRLPYYFVPPPYFATVFGDPASPSSHVVLAPRGGGKTAQRRMIEARSQETGDFLCLRYDAFDQPAGFDAGVASLAYHLNQLCRMILLGVLLRLDERPEIASRLDHHQRQLLKLQMSLFLGDLSVVQYQNAVRALQNFGDHVTVFLRKYAKPLKTVIGLITARIGLEGVDLPDELQSEYRQDESLRYHFDSLISMAQSVGFLSTYILVDKVDELASTAQNANAAFKFIQPLVIDLTILETQGVGFKFFLWDQLAHLYRENGARPDRVPISQLGWQPAELSDMLKARLLSFSDKRISSLNDMLNDHSPLDAHSLVTYFAAGSPRDMIRACKRIIAEHTKSSTVSDKIKEDTIWNGIAAFCDDRTQELFGQYFADVKKAKSPTFTTNHIANDVFRITTQAARSKIQKWQDTGIVERIGEVPNPGNRPLYLFGVTDLRVAITMYSGSQAEMFCGNYALECPESGDLCISDRDRVDCGNCNHQFSLANARSLLEICQQ